MLIKLNPKAGYIIGIGLNIMDIVAVAVDLESNLIYEVKRVRPAATATATTTSPMSIENGETIIYSLVEVVDELLQKSNIDIKQVKGIGIGIPGVIDALGKRITWPNKIGAQDITISLSVKDLFESKFGLPTFVENDANLAAFGEKWLVLDPGIKNMLYMYSGGGAGIMINGQIYEGTSHMAGEVNIHNPEFESLSEEEKKNQGIDSFSYLLRWELDIGVSVQARRAIEKGEKSIILDLGGGKIEAINFRTVIAAANKGDNLAIGLIKKAGVKLGIKIAYYVNFLNPEILVIGGGIEEAGDFILEPIKDSILKWSFEEAWRVLKIIPSQLGNRAAALGATSRIMQELFINA
jgi:glucokinase